MKNTKEKSGILYVVATPIGNLDDITYRAVQILSEVEYIAAEDTRVSGKLLKLLDLKNTQKFISCFEGNEAKRSVEIVALLKQGYNIALVSDAGTPAISDPGKRVVNEVRKNNLPIIPIPGASAAITLYSVAGLDSNYFHFEGFLPAKAQLRLARIKYMKSLQEPSIIYEAPHKIRKTLRDLMQIFGFDEEIIVARELTKIHEEIFKKTLKEIVEYYENNTPMGEFSLIVNLSASKTSSNTLNTKDSLKEHIQQLCELNLSPKIISSILVKFYNIPKKDIYFLSLEYLRENHKV